MRSRQFDGDQASEGVPDDYRRTGESGCLCDCQDLLGPDLVVVAVPPPTVAVTGEIESNGMPLAGEHRGQERPPLSVGGATMNEHETRTTPLAPVEAMDVGPLDVDPGFGTWCCERPLEPVGSGRLTH